MILQNAIIKTSSIIYKDKRLNVGLTGRIGDRLGINPTQRAVNGRVTSFPLWRYRTSGS